MLPLTRFFCDVIAADMVPGLRVRLRQTVTRNMGIVDGYGGTLHPGLICLTPSGQAENRDEVSTRL